MPQGDRPVVTTETVRVVPDSSTAVAPRPTISVVAAAQLADRVLQHRPQHGHPVPGAAAGAGQVHDQGATGDAGDAPAQHRRRHPMIDAVRGDRRRELRDLPLERRPWSARGCGRRGSGQCRRW